MPTSLNDIGQVGGVRVAVMADGECCAGVLWTWPHARERVITDDTTLRQADHFRIMFPRIGARVVDPEVFHAALREANPYQAPHVVQVRAVPRPLVVMDRLRLLGLALGAAAVLVLIVVQACMAIVRSP